MISAAAQKCVTNFLNFPVLSPQECKGQLGCCLPAILQKWPVSLLFSVAEVLWLISEASRFGPHALCPWPNFGA